MLTEIKIT